MSISHPLGHAYLLAGDPEACVNTVREQLQNLFASRQERLQIDASVVETLTIDMARELNQRGRQQAAGEARCSVRGFQLATRPAQNALLKILEEPAEGAHFFFVTPTPSHLLETVRSRTTRSDICSQNFAAITESVEAFLQAEDLPARLEIAESVAEDNRLVDFVAGLAGSIASDQIALQSALRTVSVWLQDSGRSDTQIAEFLAIAASQSSQDE